MPAEISEAHLRVGMDRATPVPPSSKLPLDWVVAQSAVRAFFTASPASTAVPAANATSPPSPTNWFCSSFAASASCPGTIPRTNQVVASDVDVLGLQAVVFALLITQSSEITLSEPQGPMKTCQI